MVRKIRYFHSLSNFKSVKSFSNSGLDFLKSEIKKFFQICTQQKRAVTTEDIRDILDNINKNNPALKRKF